MRVFIIGSNKGLSEEKVATFSTFCRNIGRELAEYAIDLVLCSPFEDSADRSIFDGLQEAPSTKVMVELHYPNQKEIENKWIKATRSENLQSNQIRHFKYPFEIDIYESQKFAWLYSQLKALNNSDVVIIVGGRIDGSASLLLRLAEEKDIVPISAFEGLSQHLFYRNYYRLRDKWAENLYLLESEETYSLLIKNTIDGLKTINKNKSSYSDPIFFLSYSRARPNEADFVEMHLRRRGLTVIRDENDINESLDIANVIQESIYKADIFVALWCKEYACSPWCYDELSIALEKQKKNKCAIWLLCLDDTRIVHPGARQLLYFKTTTRSEIEGQISILIEKSINN